MDLKSTGLLGGEGGGDTELLANIRNDVLTGWRERQLKSPRIGRPGVTYWARPTEALPA